MPSKASLLMPRRSEPWVSGLLLNSALHIELCGFDIRRPVQRVEFFLGSATRIYEIASSGQKLGETFSEARCGSREEDWLACDNRLILGVGRRGR